MPKPNERSMTPPRTSADPPPEEVPTLDPALEAALNRAIGHLAATLRRGLRRLTIAVVVCLLAVGGLGIFVLVKASQTRDALCNLRQDLQRRVAQSEDFIAHPEKYPGVKIDPKVIQAQVEGQKRTVDALEGLGCSPAPPVKVTTPSP